MNIVFDEIFYKIKEPKIIRKNKTDHTPRNV